MSLPLCRVFVKKTPNLKWGEKGYVVERFGALRCKIFIKNVLSKDV